MTYSIVAANTTTSEVGGAGASCLGGEDVYVIYAASPGRGVVHAQARYSLRARDEAARRLGEGQAPDDIIAAITASSFDDGPSVRQYGIVDVLGNTAGFTGNRTTAFAADGQGHVGDYAFSVQGNILTSARVLEQAAQGFASGCDLPERLMNALEAGADNGEGDSRCTPRGLPSDSAFLQVESPAGPVGAYLSLRVETSGDQSPLPLLRSRLEAWRSTHPCPAVMEGTSGKPGASSSQDSGCGCRVGAVEAVDARASWLLLGCGLVVAWCWRRTARQLRPALLT